MLKILIVDDIQNWRLNHFRLVRELFGVRAQTFFASSATEAYNTILEHQDAPFDIIVSDLQMEEDYEPEHAGEWFVRETKLLKQYQNTCIVLISASSDIEFVAQKLDVDFIAKPTLIYNPLAFKYLMTEKGFVE